MDPLPAGSVHAIFLLRRAAARVTGVDRFAQFHCSPLTFESVAARVAVALDSLRDGRCRHRQQGTQPHRRTHGTRVGLLRLASQEGMARFTVKGLIVRIAA